MLTLEQINLVIEKYYLLQICMFLIGWMIYDLYKLKKISKLSEKELDIVNCNIRKANKLVDKQQSNYMSIDKLKKR